MFEFSRYLPEHKPSVVRLLQLLWKNNEKECEAKFCWKHEQNPFSKCPAGVVAIHDGNIVGCRFFVAQKFQMKSQELNILSGADGIVDPEFRRQGLFEKLNFHSMVFYEKAYDFFLFMSPNIYTTPTNVKQGAQPLCKKSYLRYFSPLSILRSKKEAKQIKSKVNDDVIVTYKQEEFLSFYGRSSFLADKSTDRSIITKTKIYMNWRFRNPEYKYLYVIKPNGRGLEAYIIVRIENYGVSVIDYDEKEENGSLQLLFDDIIKNNLYGCRGYLSVMDVCLPVELRKYLIRRKFMSIDLIEKKIAKLSYNMPILLRPVKTNFSERDWLIQGNDMREIENWHLSPVCSDAG